MDRVRLLPEYNLEERIKALRRALDDMKSAPQPLGSASVLTTRVRSDDIYDIEVTNVGFRNRIVRVAYTPDDQALEGLGGVYKMEYVMTQSEDGLVSIIVERLVPETLQQQWLLHLIGNDSSPTDWVRLKFYFFTTGNGSFTAELI